MIPWIRHTLTLERFKVDALPGDADTTNQLYWNKVIAFLNEALRRGWITEPLGDKVRPFDAEIEEKSPFTDEEVEKILAEVPKLNGGTTGYAAHPKTFRLLLELMLETGMRVRDAMEFNPAALTKGAHTWNYKFKMTKRRKKGPPKIVTTYLTDKLKNAIDECQWMTPKLPFSQPENACYERMRAIGSRCGVADCRPHRLRDTFAVRKLLAGFSAR